MKWIICLLFVSGCLGLSNRSAPAEEPNGDPSRLFSKEFRFDGDIRLSVEGQERPLNAAEREKMRVFPNVDRIIGVTSELRVGHRSFDTGYLAGVYVSPAGLAEAKKSMVAPVFDARLIDGKIYALVKAEILTNLVRLDEPLSDPPGTFRVVCEVAVDSMGSGITPIDVKRPPATVGTIQAGRILTVIRHESVQVELVTENGKTYVREYPLTVPKPKEK